MAKSIKLQDNNYIDSTGIVHNRKVLADIIYPVGSIYISVNNINPSTYYGGTWVPFGAGRTLVGIDTSQSEFDSVEKTGGSKYIQDHYHLTHIDFGGNQRAECTGYSFTDSTGRPYQNTTGVQGVKTGNSGNLQPYITVYMWKRTK